MKLKKGKCCGNCKNFEVITCNYHQITCYSHNYCDNFEEKLGEVITKIEKLEEGKSYVAGYEDYLITEKHSLADIVRWLQDMGFDSQEVGDMFDELDIID